MGVGTLSKRVNWGSGGSHVSQAIVQRASPASGSVFENKSNLKVFDTHSFNLESRRW